MIPFEVKGDLYPGNNAEIVYTIPRHIKPLTASEKLTSSSLAINLRYSSYQSVSNT